MMTVAQLLNRKLSELGGRRLKLAASLGKYVMATFGGHNIEAITPSEIEAYMRGRCAQGASPFTVASEIGFLARLGGHTWKQLWPSVQQPKRFYRKPSIAEVERLRFVAARSKCKWVRLFIDLATYHKLRKRDVSKLRWEDIAAMPTAIDKQNAAAKHGRIAPGGWRRAWENIRRRAQVQCRFDDLRRVKMPLIVDAATTPPPAP